MFVADVPVAVGVGGAQGAGEDALGLAGEGAVAGEAPPAAPGALRVRRQRPRPVGLLHAGDDLGEVDAEAGEGVRVGAGEPAPAAGLGEVPLDRFPAVGPGESQRGQSEGGTGGLAVQQGEEEVLLGHLPRSGAFGVVHRSQDHGTGVFREPFEHQCLPYFLCTACLLTPSSAAISCHDQP